MIKLNYEFNPKLDLKLERILEVPVEMVWKCYTTAKYLEKWFCPIPWKTTDYEIDLRPGGTFKFVMISPEGQEFPNLGCYLEVTKNEKLVWTNALVSDYRPALKPLYGADFFMTAKILLESQGKNTKYTAIINHKNEEDRNKHEKMGFHDGWSKTLDQLTTLSKTI